MEVKEFVDVVEDFVNTFESDRLTEAGKRLSRMHPTLQQNFMRLVIAFVEAEAEKTHYDLRNKDTVELCKRIKEIAEDVHLLFV